MWDEPRTILLAGPSLLYAPVFLAKYCRLSPVFDHLKLDWEPERREFSNHEDTACSDPVLAALLAKHSNHDVVIAVCDPCRVGYLPVTGQFREPVLLSGLIGKVCLDYNTLEGLFFDDVDVLTTADEIIVHDPEMTSFAVTVELIKLLSEGGKLRDGLPRLHFGVPIGMEHLEARARTLVRRNSASVRGASVKRLVYSSCSSPGAVGSGKHRSVSALKDGDDLLRVKDRYKKFLFTGLLTTDKEQKDNPQFLQQIVSAIAFAIDVIEADPSAAAHELWRVPELRHALERNMSRKDAAVFLEQMVEEEVFMRCDKPAYADRASYQLHLQNAIETHKEAALATDRLAEDSNTRTRIPGIVRRSRFALTRLNKWLPPPGSGTDSKGAQAALQSDDASSTSPQPDGDEDLRGTSSAIPFSSTSTVPMARGDVDLLSSRHLFKVPIADRIHWIAGALTILLFCIVFLSLLGWFYHFFGQWENAIAGSDLFRSLEPSLADCFVFAKEHPPPKQLPVYVLGTLFVLVGCMSLALIEQPKRRASGGSGLLDWCAFLVGMGLILTAVRKLAVNDDTMLSVLFGWGALFYGFSKVARRAMPDPSRWWNATRQRWIQAYEFRRALWQAAWESRYPQRNNAVTRVSKTTVPSPPQDLEMRCRFTIRSTSKRTFRYLIAPWHLGAGTIVVIFAYYLFHWVLFSVLMLVLLLLHRWFQRRRYPQETWLMRMRDRVRCNVATRCVKPQAFITEPEAP